MARAPQDWHREDIKAAIRKTGTTLGDLSTQHGYSICAVRLALLKPWPKVEALIATHLGCRPQDIWPSRYDAAGNAKMGHRRSTKGDDTAGRDSAHRQKRVAA